MLQIADGTQITTDVYYIQHMSDGRDQLHFDLSIFDPSYRVIREETRIIEMTEQQTYIVKSIAAGQSTVKIACTLDLSDWLRSICVGYSRTGLPIEFLRGTTVGFSGDSGPLRMWEMVESGLYQGEKRHIEMQGPTPLDIALQMQETFPCSIRFYTTTKRAEIIWPDQIPLSSAYAIDTVNLRSAPEFKGKSSEIYTRLYPVGKDGLRIEGEYVENLTYTTDIICKVWVDSRYEDPVALKTDAQRKVDEDSQPIRSWKLDVVDLKRIDPSKWNHMDLSMFRKLRLIDEYKGFSAIVQVCEDKVYPYYPERNEITVSTTTGSVQRTLKAVYRQITDPNSAFYQKLDARRVL